MATALAPDPSAFITKTSSLVRLRGLEPYDGRRSVFHPRPCWIGIDTRCGVCQPFRATGADHGQRVDCTAVQIRVVARPVENSLTVG